MVRPRLFKATKKAVFKLTEAPVSRIDKSRVVNSQIDEGHDELERLSALVRQSEDFYHEKRSQVAVTKRQAFFSNPFSYA